MWKRIETVLYHEYFKEYKESWDSQNGIYVYYAYIIVARMCIMHTS